MFGATKFLVITCYKHPFMLVMRPCCDTKGLARQAAGQTTVHARVKGTVVGATPETGRLRHQTSGTVGGPCQAATSQQLPAAAGGDPARWREKKEIVGLGI